MQVLSQSDGKKNQPFLSSLPVCLFLGQKSCGKSTLISHLCGAELKFKKEGLKYHISHNHPQCPPINNDRKNVSKSSHVCLTDNGQILYEPRQEVAPTTISEEKENVCLHERHLQAGGYLKIIIVIDTPSLLSKQADVFTRATERLKELFKNDFEAALPSCMLVVTKVNIVYSLSDIYEYISDIATSIRGNKESKLLMKALLDQRNITIHSTPERMSKYIEVIRNKIENLKYSSRKLAG